MSKRTCGECPHNSLDEFRRKVLRFNLRNSPKPLVCNNGAEVNSDWPECPARTSEKRLERELLELRAFIPYLKAASCGNPDEATFLWENKKLKEENASLREELAEAREKYKELAKHMCLLKNATDGKGEKIGDILLMSFPQEPILTPPKEACPSLPSDVIQPAGDATVTSCRQLDRSTDAEGQWVDDKTYWEKPKSDPRR